MKEDHSVITWYRFTEIEDLEKLRDQLTAYCKEHNILGRILMGVEGINGATCGPTPEIEKFKPYLQKIFPGLTFREEFFNQNTYHKLVVRIRDEIVAMGGFVDMEKTAPHLPPEKLKEMYDNDEDFVILDIRNGYEYDQGHFKNAVKVDMETFRDFPRLLKEDLEQYKDKQIVTYCTGGIRCEKATALMKEHGFNKVKQLSGGVINYVKNYPDTYWEDGLVVFDNRRVSDINDEKAVNTCIHCGKKSKEIIPCNKIDFDEKDKEFRCLLQIKPEKIIAYNPLGRVQNYFEKNSIAHVIVDEPIKVGDEITFVGDATGEYTEKITEIRLDDGTSVTETKPGDSVTIPVKRKVREKDYVLFKAEV